VKSYAGGMLLVSASSVLLSQLDKVILSRVLTLDEFGYYVLAWNLALMLNRPAAMVLTAWLPRMTQQFTMHDSVGLARSYISGTQVVTALVLPAALVLCLLPGTVLQIYLGHSAWPGSLPLALAMLAAGSACNALMHLPYGLTLACRLPSFAVYQNIVASLTIVPLAVYGATHFGLAGGAFAWLAVNVLYVIFSVWAIHRKLLPGMAGQWYTTGVLPGLLVASCSALAALALASGHWLDGRSGMAAVLGVPVAAGMAFAAWWSLRSATALNRTGMTTGT